MWMKVYIFFAWVSDTIHEILLLSTSYVYLVKDIGDTSALSEKLP